MPVRPEATIGPAGLLTASLVEEDAPLAKDRRLVEDIVSQTKKDGYASSVGGSAAGPFIPRISHEFASGSMLTRVSVNTEGQAPRLSSWDSPHFADAFSKSRSVNARLQITVCTYWSLLDDQ